MAIYLLFEFVINPQIWVTFSLGDIVPLRRIGVSQGYLVTVLFSLVFPLNKQISHTHIHTMQHLGGGAVKNIIGF